MKICTFACVSWLIVMIITPGCADREKQRARDAAFFPPEEGRRDIRASQLAQAAKAARLNATLTSQHYKGVQLNSLGHQQIALMMFNRDPDAAFRIYLDLPSSDALIQPRREQVPDDLKSQGIDASK